MQESPRRPAPIGDNFQSKSLPLPVPPMNNLAALDDTNLGLDSLSCQMEKSHTHTHTDFNNKKRWEEVQWAQVYLLSLPESEILPQEQRELRQETHYSLSWQYPANASLWQPVHLINPEGNKRQSLVLIQSSKAYWVKAVGMVVRGTNHSLPPSQWRGERGGSVVNHLFQEWLSPPGNRMAL